jgi:ABC-type lipoprotein export system ATPase subunit
MEDCLVMLLHSNLEIHEIAVNAWQVVSTWIRQTQAVAVAGPSGSGRQA